MTRIGTGGYEKAWEGMASVIRNVYALLCCLGGWRWSEGAGDVNVEIFQ